MERRLKIQANPRIYIGIDTGTQTGVAIYDPATKTLAALHTVAIHKAMEIVKAYHSDFGDGLFVWFEDARLRKWIPECAGRERLQGAGSVKRDAKIWEDFLKDLGVRYEAVAPKNNKTKMSAEAFKHLTGWKGKSSSHARDAAMLVFQM